MPKEKRDIELNKYTWKSGLTFLGVKVFTCA